MQGYEDEEFWREMYPYMFPPEKFSAAEEQVSQILSLAAVAGGPVLDLCCGPGRHAIEFARRGFRVTGVDGTNFLLNQAKERAAQSGQQVEMDSPEHERVCETKYFPADREFVDLFWLLQK